MTTSLGRFLTACGGGPLSNGFGGGISSPYGSVTLPSPYGAAAAVLLAASAFAAPPSLTPKVLQCDGSFMLGVNTSHPNPTIQVEEQSISPGLKIGSRRLSILPSVTKALWRFDGDYTVTVSSCYTGGCPSGSECKTWRYSYIDPNNSAILNTGLCSYSTNTITSGCTPLTDMTAFGASQAPVQVGACPANPSTLPAASSSMSITAVGPLPGATTLGLSSSALQLNGSTQYGTAPDNTAWDLEASYTLAAWVNPTAAVPGGRIVSNQGPGGFWGIGIVSTGSLRHFDSRDIAAPDVTVGPDIRGGWHLVHVVRRNNDNNGRRFYVDGKLVGTAVVSSSDSFVTHPVKGSLEIGRLVSGSEFFAGTIDDVRILSNIALSDDDIFLEWNTQIHRFSANSGVSFSTASGSYAGSPANGTGAIVTYTTATAVPLEPYSTAARWIFMAQNIDGESATSQIYEIAVDISSPTAPALAAVATSSNDITWSWGMPSHVCLPPGSASVFYQLVNAQNGSTLTPPGDMVHPTFTVGENLPGGPNQLVGRKLRVNDTWGAGLSAATSVYTFANPPLAGSVAATLVSTGSALISWNQNGNPSYTRYGLNYSTNANFAPTVSTPVALSDDFTGNSRGIAGLAAGTTYFVRVQSFNGRSTDAFGGVASVFVSTSFTTRPPAPTLAGSPLSNASIQWGWSQQPGAQYYNLFDGIGALLYSGGALSFIQGSLAVNTQYTASVEAVSNNGASARAFAQTFTLANDPTLPTVAAVYPSSVAYSWNPNGNPGYTFYEVNVTTNATFLFIASTLTVNATAATAPGLLPNTTYYARLRSINGGQLTGNFVAIAAARTTPDSTITVNEAPPSSYIPPNNTVGQWQFDENTGATAADSSGLGNTALLTCTAAACVSTPTFAAGPPGLGSAVAFSGLNDGLVRAADTAAYAFTDSVSIEAWVNPDTTSQPNGAGLVVRGSGTVENFALDIFGALYRFTPRPGFAASSTNTITAGTWTHLIGVYDAAVGSATLYVNGRAASTVLSVPVRFAANHDISIGNRQSGLATPYDRGFLGRIDSVRVLRRALNAAGALAEFEGGFVSTITPASPNQGVLVGLPPNAFGAPATLFVTSDPFGHPISMSAAALNAGLAVVPTGFTLVPNSIIEIVAIVGGTPFTQTLGSEATVSLPYNDADGNNLIDGANPPLAASTLRVYTLNTTVNRWELLPSVIDSANRRITARTPHFSVFALLAPFAVGTSASSVRVYPIPWKPGSRDRFDAPGITFDRLPQSGSIYILNLAGERVRRFTFDGADAGTKTWDGRNDGGRRTASGVYFARIVSHDGAAAVIKFAIER